MLQKFVISTFVIFSASLSLALPSQGEFIASQCGTAPYKDLGNIEVCFGTIYGAPAFENANPNGELIYVNLANQNYVGKILNTVEPSPTQPLESEQSEVEIQMTRISDGRTTPVAGADVIPAKIKYQGDRVISAEFTLSSGVLIKAKSFSSVGGAR